MKEENAVSIWVGTFKDKEELSEFVREQYDEDGDFLPSLFMKTFETGYSDADFREVLFKENLSKEDLFQASYAETFANKTDGVSGNGVILLYDFRYTGQTREANNIRFIGTFNYTK